MFNEHAADILAALMNLILSDLVLQRNGLHLLEIDASLYVNVSGSVCACADIIAAMMQHESYRAAFAADGAEYQAHVNCYVYFRFVASSVCFAGRSFNPEAFAFICR